MSDFELHEKLALHEVLESGLWGTISPKSVEAANYISQLRGMKYGIMLFSASAALEALLRSLEIGYGDQVVCASYGNPINAMTTAIVGATPIFADIDFDTCNISIESIKSLITDNTKAVIVDMIAGNSCDMIKLSNLCNDKNLFLIENAVDGYKTSYKYKQTSEYCCASIMDLSTSKSIDIGEGGAIITDNEDIFQAAFAYHNCGRHFGEYTSINTGGIIGGDLRVAEWQSTLVKTRSENIDEIINARIKKAEYIKNSLTCGYLTPLKEVEEGVSSCSAVIFIYNSMKNKNISIDDYISQLKLSGINAYRGYKAMHRQPVFNTEYFKKLTGNTKAYCDTGLDNSIKAEENYIWISL